MTDSALTLERIRADVAAILEAPASAVEDGMNLLDLGLDSMRIMELAQRWSDESGAFVDAASLMEEPEVTAWWKRVSDPGG